MGMQSFNAVPVPEHTTAHIICASPKAGPSEAKHLVLRGLPSHAPPSPVCQNAGEGLDPSRWPVVVDPDTGCWLWQGLTNPDGYGRVWGVKSATDQPYYLAHRLVYETEVGPIPEGLVPDHRCRVPNCVNPSPYHSQLVTRGQNCRRGSNTKLTWADVEEIRALVADGMKQQAVADLFGVSYTNISHIVNRRRWAVDSHEQAYGEGWSESSTAHAAEADSPHAESGITARDTPCFPNGPRLRAGSPGGAA